MLPSALLDRPVAHRALHGRGRPENSRAAIEAAVAGGYGIEIDLQMSADGQAMVFHDHDLGRLTDATGPVRQRSAAELATIQLRGGTEGIPTLDAVLATVSGRAPLLIEVKDQDGAKGAGTGPLEDATVHALARYTGPVALMSFNPHSVRALHDRAPHLPVGLTTCAYHAAHFPDLPAQTRDRLGRIADFAAVGACFVSHEWRDLDNPAIAALKARGVPILSWTIRSPEEERTARRIADGITFEGYLA